MVLKVSANLLTTTFGLLVIKTAFGGEKRGEISNNWALNVSHLVIWNWCGPTENSGQYQIKSYLVLDTIQLWKVWQISFQIIMSEPKNFVENSSSCQVYHHIPPDQAVHFIANMLWLFLNSKRGQNIRHILTPKSGNWAIFNSKS